ncbi:anti-sigma regulatory factor [Pseudonocardia humida]|uniref:Anti-sigma regulatory factor n=1 Tax=Pseudonocardia humida TaxID=2800819 RepID=A0ABT0ZXT0_9PSEU|nr:anti-sigma regulatory factor [Pseudonocardia humida]MCO1655554.1 anti-sigma regulatory factor [Pseudonocardia humida]
MSTSATGVDELPVTSGDDVVRVRQLVRSKAQSIRLSLVDQTKLVTAASELARNTLVHGGSGSARIEVVQRGGRSGIRAVFSDTGPGIADLDLALTPGWTSGGGLGLGLSGAKRLVDEFDIDTEVGRGTSVAITKWSR